MKKSTLRLLGHSVLVDHGFTLRQKPGQGYLPASRMLGVKGGQTTEIAVKATQERILGFTKRSKLRWRTLDAVDLVVVVTPAEAGSSGVDVFAFERRPLVRAFNSAWTALQDAQRSLSFEIPVFVPLDKSSHWKLGHDVGDLKRLAAWCVRLTDEEAQARSLGESDETYIETFQRRFAKDNGVDVSQVLISIAGPRK